ncbi:hypothetical protein PAI11_37390 [Patulibacter medicamentivorans]|uniref:Uncharacterized protein n=1 Tax=Patulibacter medicamentivorans TaxID=1097667 RepID=H0EA65_9ACTN|nr:hypothetical protein [Patulibacter medicamentivorans]EHN09405.1 hypothetical protein PAI11_37390 [Patulibacter medicamentivorans]
MPKHAFVLLDDLIRSGGLYPGATIRINGRVSTVERIGWSHDRISVNFADGSSLFRIEAGPDSAVAAARATSAFVDVTVTLR